MASSAVPSGLRVPAVLAVLCVLFYSGVVAGDDCDAYLDSNGQWHTKQYCSISFCCGTCDNRYCCINPFYKLDEDNLFCSVNSASFGTFIAVGITIFVVFVVAIILCFTCSCCCLYKMCRRPPQPVVTTTTATVIHAPYPQQQGVPQNYPAPAPYPPQAPYPGYQPLPVQPSQMYPGMPGGGMPTAPYSTQYPPPYPVQPGGPPGYQETMATGAGVPYPAAQPPYNPAFVDSPKQPY